MGASNIDMRWKNAVVVVECSSATRAFVRVIWTRSLTRTRGSAECYGNRGAMTWDLLCSVCTRMTGEGRNYGYDDCRKTGAVAIFFSFFVKGLETLSAIYKSDNM